jgi:hypothetical protein
MPLEQTCAQLRIQAVLKLLHVVRDESTKLVRLLHEHALEQFFAFKPETISSANFLQRIEKQLLPALQFCDDEQIKNEEYRTLKQLATAFVEIHEHLVLFYKDSIQAALERTDDPKALQKLLELL